MSNTWVIYLRDRDNLLKGGLISDNTFWAHVFKVKGGLLRRYVGVLPFADKPASYQLVGEVKARQGYDGYRD